MSGSQIGKSRTNDPSHGYKEISVRTRLRRHTDRAKARGTYEAMAEYGTKICSAPKSPAKAAFRLEIGLDLNIHTARQFETRKCIHSRRRSIHDIYETLVGVELELLTALLIDESRAVHSKYALVGGQRDRTFDLHAGRLDSLDDLLCGLIHECVVVRLDLDAYDLAHIFIFSLENVDGKTYYSLNEIEEQLTSKVPHDHHVLRERLWQYWWRLFRSGQRTS